MTITATDFDFIRQMVKNSSAIALDDGKEYLVEMRLSTLIRKLEIPSIADLVSNLRSSSASSLHQMVVEAMTTNETSFFRDAHPFEVLEKTILPEILAKRRSERKLSIWCAASSTGQEPYTIAMILCEAFPEIRNWKIEFLATDISEGVLAHARKGCFSQLEVNRGLPAPLLVKYFDRVGTDWVIKEELRRMIKFQYMNLNQQWLPMPKLDLVFIRNVLIYFTVETKKKILKQIEGMMRPDGYLFLGTSESTLHLDSSFERVALGRAACYRFPQST
ncbi:MAG: protein-glutamate O-methyltransferase CheR [Verrucomicrobia bacterium]|nr:protein-glutamate O-methyltransferase CheR [Verrucomicrobiota bacterium]